MAYGCQLRAHIARTVGSRLGHNAVVHVGRVAGIQRPDARQLHCPVFWHVCQRKTQVVQRTITRLVRHCQVALCDYALSQRQLQVAAAHLHARHVDACLRVFCRRAFRTGTNGVCAARQRTDVVSRCEAAFSVQRRLHQRHQSVGTPQHVNLYRSAVHRLSRVGIAHLAADADTLALAVVDFVCRKRCLGERRLNIQSRRRRTPVLIITLVGLALFVGPCKEVEDANPAVGQCHLEGHVDRLAHRYWCCRRNGGQRLHGRRVVIGDTDALVARHQQVYCHAGRQRSQTLVAHGNGAAHRLSREVWRRRRQHRCCTDGVGQRLIADHEHERSTLVALGCGIDGGIVVVVLHTVLPSPDGEGSLRLAVGNGHRGRQLQLFVVGGQPNADGACRRVTADCHRCCAATLL